MASLKEDVPLAPQPLPREINNPRPPPPLQRPQMGNSADPADSGVLKCTCFHLRSLSKKKPAPAPLVTVTTKLSSASRRGTVVADASTPSQSQRVTFLASAYLSTRWPSSPSAASAGPAPGPGCGSVAPKRASSSSFSYWRRSLSSRIMPHGAAASRRASFSFPTSPASASSSCMSTPKIPHGCQR